MWIWDELYYWYALHEIALKSKRGLNITHNTRAGREWGINWMHVFRKCDAYICIFDDTVRAYNIYPVFWVPSTASALRIYKYIVEKSLNKAQTGSQKGKAKEELLEFLWCSVSMLCTASRRAYILCFRKSNIEAYTRIANNADIAFSARLEVVKGAEAMHQHVLQKSYSNG